MKKIILNLLVIAFLTCHSGTVLAQEVFSIKNNEEMKISTLIHLMAKKSGMESLVNPKIDGTVLISFENKTIEQAMNLLGDAYGFGWYIEDNTIVASPTDQMVTRNQRFPLRFADPVLVKEELKAFIDEKQITVYPEDVSISVDCNLINMKKVEEKIKKIDLPPRQVLMKAQIIELSRTNSEELGFRHTWGQYNNKADKGTIQYAVTAEAKKILSKGQVIAAPSIMTINGRQAILEMGAQYPVLMTNTENDGSKDTTVKYEDIGYFLTATPRINVDQNKKEFVTLNVEAKASSITGWVENSDTKAPQMSKRKAITNVRVANGDTVIIGGLVKDEEMRTLTKIPVLSNIPIIGELFKHRSKTKDSGEIFIFLTPYIIPDGGEK